MFFATKKSEGVDHVMLWDGEESTFKFLSDLVDGAEVTPPVYDEGGALLEGAVFAIAGVPLARGEVIAIRDRALVDVEVVAVCQFMDTKGTYGLIKEVAVDCVPLEFNAIDMPTRLRTGGGDVQLGEYVLIRRDGTTAPCLRRDYDTFGQAVGVWL